MLPKDTEMELFISQTCCRDKGRDNVDFTTRSSQLSPVNGAVQTAQEEDQHERINEVHNCCSRLIKI